MNQNKRIPITNSGARQIEIGIEPEGDCFPLNVGETLELRFVDEDAALELEIEGSLISIHCMSTKEVWKAGSRLR